MSAAEQIPDVASDLGGAIRPAVASMPLADDQSDSIEQPVLMERLQYRTLAPLAVELEYVTELDMLRIP